MAWVEHVRYVDEESNPCVSKVAKLHTEGIKLERGRTKRARRSEEISVNHFERSLTEA